MFVCVFSEERNSLGVDRLFVHNHHVLYPVIKTLYEDNHDTKVCSYHQTSHPVQWTHCSTNTKVRHLSPCTVDVLFDLGSLKY